MDGPTVPWTVGDLFMWNKRVFMFYHVTTHGYNYLTPIGCLVGAALPLTSKFSAVPRLQCMGNGGLVGGAAGAMLGLALMRKIANSESAKTPWDDEGIQQRVDGLSHNYMVRSMDLGVWAGIVGAGAALVYAGGPTKLGLAKGALGSMQAVSLGSLAAWAGTMGIIMATK